MPNRIVRFVRMLPLIAIALLVSKASLGGDPDLRWYTVKTPRFHIHYSSGLGPLAQDLASIVTRIENRLVPDLGFRPTDITEIVLTDGTDAANGSASVVPYNIVRLFATAPDDMSTLNDYGNWPVALFTHEETHVLQLSNVSGLPAVLNKIFGRRYMPNSLQPRWILEGLAVAQESRHTSGGRNRSTLFDMYLRADVLEGNMAGLAVMSNNPWRWPGATLWYLYGGKFVNFILDVYGAGVYADVATVYGENIVPWGLNRALKSATGRTYPELYRAWKLALEDQYQKQVAAVKARGLREGVRLTHLGREGAYPRWRPQCSGGGGEDDPALVYFVDDGNNIGGLYEVPLVTPTQAGDLRLLARARGGSSTFLPNCQMLFENIAPYKTVYRFYELFLQRGVQAEQLTQGSRARYPDVSPDGQRIVYVTNSAGTRTLRIANLDATGRISDQRTLVPSERYEQAFTPRFSPNGRKVAYGTWTTGGFRDIRIVDVATREFVSLQHDRAIDQQPVWSPDGETLYYVSDRSGIANIYAYDIEAGTTRMVSNVRTGAYMPAISADGNTLYYVGYSSSGFDLWALPVERDQWLDVRPNTQQRPAAEEIPKGKQWPVTPYSAWGTVYPRSWGFEAGADNFGSELTLSTSGADAVGLHSYRVSATIRSNDWVPQGNVTYTYHRLPFRFDLRAFVYAASREGGLYGDADQIFIERTSGATSAISMDFPGVFEGQTLSLSYTASIIDGEVPIDPNVDPYALIPSIPNHGLAGIVRLGYSFSNTIRPSLAISDEHGIKLKIATDLASEETGSDWTLTAFFARLRGYILAPWGDHQVLALALSGATATGNYAREGFYRVGGFQDDRLQDDIMGGTPQGAFVLRGYAPREFFGRKYVLLNSEYRFPLWYAEQGISTLPAFLRTVAGAAFADYGGAFDELNLDDPTDRLHLGLGGEIRLHFIFGYFMNLNLRVGYAHGFGDRAIPEGQFYTVMAGDF
jgi:hypothetical protein